MLYFSGKITNREIPIQQVLFQPKPKRPVHEIAPFLGEFVDPVHPALHQTPGFVSRWLESVGVNPPKRPKSESYLDRVPDHCELRKFVRSAPDMDTKTYNSGFLVPPSPDQMDIWSRSFKGAEYSNSTKVIGAVRNSNYRRNNLAFNGVNILAPCDEFPDHMIPHIQRLGADRHSPELPPEKVEEYMQWLSELDASCNETDVESFVGDALLPEKRDPAYGREAGLQRTRSSLMAAHLVPRNHGMGTIYRISQPKPDYLYGYSFGNEAFTMDQLLAQERVHPTHPNFGMVQPSVVFPFLVIEVKADGGTGGSLWVASNQAAGAAAVSLNASEQLNKKLQECQSGFRVDNVFYAITVINYAVQLYVAWKEDDSKFSMQRVRMFSPDNPKHFRELRKAIWNILDWGKGSRFNQVRNALDIIWEDHCKKTSAQAKSRPPPFEGSVGSVAKRARSVSSWAGGKTRIGSSLRNEISQVYGTPNTGSSGEASVRLPVEALTESSMGTPTPNVDQSPAQTTALDSSNPGWGLYPAPAMPPSPSQSAQPLQNPYQPVQPPYVAAGGQYYFPNTPDGGYSQYVPDEQGQGQALALSHESDNKDWQL
ncbi:uncharacterized protein C8A04DRAFT_14509 [Dichotomopilus funicola]|uniref:DUF7924 domain-containing protein n=1 Tax=Dichotomopilus funicola TaxID=1934379 RepID=A0AAN6UXC4_9PEZI|nr:hypothetical protein C8A04DRAFT_14509 [Dichotomopilus funicola]